MSKNIIPKWQQELRAFLGIKSGIILEGNVYDEYPRFLDGPEGAPHFRGDTAGAVPPASLEPQADPLPRTQGMHRGNHPRDPRTEGPALSAGALGRLRGVPLPGPPGEQ